MSGSSAAAVIARFRSSRFRPKSPSRPREVLHAAIGERPAEQELIGERVDSSRRRHARLSAVPRLEDGQLVEQRDPGVVTGRCHSRARASFGLPASALNAASPVCVHARFTRRARGSARDARRRRSVTRVHRQRDRSRARQLAKHLEAAVGDGRAAQIEMLQPRVVARGAACLRPSASSTRSGRGPSPPSIATDVREHGVRHLSLGIEPGGWMRGEEPDDLVPLARARDG